MFGFGIVNRPEETQNDVDESLVEKHKWAALVLLNPIFLFFWGGNSFFHQSDSNLGWLGTKRELNHCAMPPGL